MSGKDLMDLLGMGDEGPSPGLEIAAGAAGGKVAPPSSTALEHNEWSLARGEDCVRECEPMQQHKTDALEAADFHGLYFEPEPQWAANPDPDCKLRSEFLKQVEQTPEYREARGLTTCSTFNAQVAAAALAERWAGVKKDEGERQEAEKAQEGQKPGQGGKSPGKGKGATGKGKDGDQEVRLMVAASEAAAQASQEVEAAEDAARAIGFGDGPGGKADAKKMAAVFRRARNSPFLRKVIDWAGRFRRAARSCQKARLGAGYDDMVGVTLDGDPARLLASELMLLENPVLKLDLLRRIAEKQAMCRDYRSIEPSDKGPIIACFDESMSMEDNDRIYMAKGLALTMYWIARQQKRFCCLVGWSGRWQRRTLVLEPGRTREDELFAWLEGWFRGGTEPPIPDMPAIYDACKAPKGKTDVLMVTDGECLIEPLQQEAFKAWKAVAKARMISLVIGQPSQGVGLDVVSDELYRINDLAPDDQAVQRVLGI